MRTRSPLKARACSPLQARMCSPLMARTYSPLKVIGTSTQGSTFMRKQEIESLRGPFIPNSKDWTLDGGNLCS